MLKNLALLLVGLLIVPSAFATEGRSVLIVLNQGYRPEEYWSPRKLFDTAKFKVTVAAHYAGDVLPSRTHLSEVPPVKADLTFDQVLASNYDAIVFVGGNGAWNDLLPSPAVHKILLESVKLKKVTGLICAATGLLATANNLDGKNPQFAGRHVTGYFEVEGILRQMGRVNFDAGEAGKPYVVTDGKLITGRDPLSAQLFGETVVAALTSKP